MPLNSDYVLKEPVVDRAQIIVCRPYLVELRIRQIVCSVHHVIKECPQPVELLLSLFHYILLSWCHFRNFLVSEHSVARRHNPELLVCERRTHRPCESLQLLILILHSGRDLQHHLTAERVSEHNVEAQAILFGNYLYYLWILFHILYSLTLYYPTPNFAESRFFISSICSFSSGVGFSGRCDNSSNLLFSSSFPRQYETSFQNGCRHIRNSCGFGLLELYILP